MKVIMSNKLTALKLGLISHLLFAFSIVLMFISLYGNSYLYIDLFESKGSDFIWNTFLLAFFVLGHSFLLTNNGRPILQRLAPSSIAKQMETTSFATLSSLMLLATFFFWQPYNLGTLYLPSFFHHLMSIVYVFSWILLGYSMICAGLGVQIGYIGWLSVFKNKKPIFGSFPTKGLFGITRNPIYLSFFLILWSGPVWTFDHLEIALVWSLYCILGPKLKEKRYLMRYGDPYIKYKEKTPYFIPKRF